MKAQGWKMEVGACNGRAGTPLPAAARRGLRALPLRSCVSAMILMCGLGALAQYSINWHTIDGGVGTSTNGQFSLNVTIGQHDAGGPMTNGQYSVTGGFWVLPQAVQVTGAPTLTIAPAAPGFATISWAPATPGFVLQETWSLTVPNWTNSLSATTNPIIVPAVLPQKFYRLIKP